MKKKPNDGTEKVTKKSHTTRPVSFGGGDGGDDRPETRISRPIGELLVSVFGGDASPPASAYLVWFLESA